MSSCRGLIQQIFALLWGLGSGLGARRGWWLSDITAFFFFAFCILQLDTPHAPRPHNKANLCCTKLRLAGCEPHMSGRNPFYLLKIFLLTAEEGRGGAQLR